MTARTLQTITRTPINFLGPLFEPMDRVSTTDVPQLIQSGILQSRDAFIHLYDGEHARQLFFFRQHGFEYCQLKDPVVAALSQMATEPTERTYRISLRESIVPSLIEWGHGQHLQFNVVVPLDTVYRDSNYQQSGNAFGPVNFAHVDFPSTDLSGTLSHFQDAWKAKIELAMSQQRSTILTDEQYASIQAEQVINLWMPLPSLPTKNTLALMDCSSISQFDQELQPYTAIRQMGSSFTALGLYPSEGHRWVIQSDMKLGDAVIFDSLRTPHTAVSVDRPAAVGEHRQSVEIRVLFLNVRENLLASMNA